MSTYRQRPVTQIITDAGPLISLAVMERLDLLQAFRKPVLIPDVIRMECTRKLGAPGEAVLSDWFSGVGKNQFEEIKTPFGPTVQNLIEKERAGEEIDDLTGMGDATISWVVANLPRLKEKDDLALILTQDSAFGDTALRATDAKVHVLGFRAWLGFLAQKELIPSVASVVETLRGSGRHLSRYAADRPAVVDAGTRSNWKDASEGPD